MLVTKEIIPKNTYKVRTNHGRMSKVFNEEYLKKVAETSNKMLEAGLRIPAPFDHHKEAKPRTDKEQQDFEKIAINEPKSAYNNAGYWQKFWVAPNSKGVPALYGQLDAKGDISDTNSPAYKVMNSNEEVSVSITDSFEDGLGRSWTDGLMHVAIVNHAVVPGQEPFKEVPDGVTVVNMSMVESTDDSSPNVGGSVVEELKAALRKLKINLPGSTTASTFMRDLLVAALQIPETSDNDLQPVPIYMSIGDNDMALTQAQAEALVATKSTNPATNKPWTMEDFGFKVAPTSTPATTDLSAIVAEKDQEIATYKALASAFKNKFIEDTKTNIQKRISALVRSGVIPKEYAEANLVPKVEFQMSVVGGKIEEHPLEILLSTLETMPAKTPAAGAPSSFLDGVIQDNPLEGAVGELDDATMEKALASLQADGFLN